MTFTTKEHWNKIYNSQPVTQLGWYEARAYPSTQLIQNCDVPRQAPVVDVGSGATTLIAELLALGYEDLYAVDISAVALEKAKTLLGEQSASQVHWIEADITHPATTLAIQNAAVWHDRAAFHFLIDPQQRENYLALLRTTVMPGGFVIIATFALHGAPNCSGLPVQRYSAASLVECLGDGFSLMESLDTTYQQPSGGLRPYVYARFRKNPA